MKVYWIVLDSVGTGAAPDAYLYGDEGANTLRSALSANPKLPNLKRLGFCNYGRNPLYVADKPLACHGIAEEKAPGKDTITGHWEMAGLILKEPFPVYPHGFPKDVITALERETGRQIIGNIPASGTEIIQLLGEKQIAEGSIIVYTSADSVMQIAAHEAVVPVAELYDICRKARRLMQGEHAIGRIIARPFIGGEGSFSRTDNRRDFAYAPPGDTVLDLISRQGLQVHGIGKIEDIFVGRGLTQATHTANNEEGIAFLLADMRENYSGLCFVNLVDFDSVYGHRRNISGYAGALEQFDAALPDIFARLKKEDLLIITADHGCDPGFKGTDHTREYVPVIAYSHELPPADIGVRNTFADTAATVAAFLGIPYSLAGKSYLPPKS